MRTIGILILSIIAIYYMVIKEFSAKFKVLTAYIDKNTIINENWYSNCCYIYKNTQLSITYVRNGYGISPVYKKGSID